jgi:hypothetical protein
MAKQQVTVFLFMEERLKDDYSGMELAPRLWPVKVDENERRFFVSEQTVEVEVPDNFDPRAKQIAALEERKREMTAKFQAAVTEINRRISELQAIEFAA